MHREMRAALIREVQTAREHLDMAMSILLPEDDAEESCPHPADKIMDLSTMGESLYRCTVCGVEQSEVFHSSTT